MKTAGHLDALRPERGNWLRLQTLVLLRWMAIAGQLVAIGVATRVYDIDLPLALCFMAVGVAVMLCTAIGCAAPMVIEPMRKGVAGVTARPAATSARPKPWLKIGTP